MIERKTETGKEIRTIVVVDCNTCGSETRHMIQASYYIDEREDVNEFVYFAWYDFFQIIECQGCQEVSFRKVHTNSEDCDSMNGYTKFISVYPNRINTTIQEKPLKNVPSIIKKIYRETINSYNNDILILCGIGIRALVEGICKEKNVLGGKVIKNSGSETRNKDLYGKIHGLHQQGILTEEYANILHQHRFLGNDAAHELLAPSKEELSLAIEIIENTLITIYEIPKKGAKLKHSRLNNL